MVRSNPHQILKPMEKKYSVLIGSSYVIELIITEEIARMCYHSGCCDEDVKDGIEIPFIKEQLAHFETEQLEKVVNEYVGDVSKTMNRNELECWVLFESSALFIDGDCHEIEE